MNIEVKHTDITPNNYVATHSDLQQVDQDSLCLYVLHRPSTVNTHAAMSFNIASVSQALTPERHPNLVAIFGLFRSMSVSERQTSLILSHAAGATRIRTTAGRSTDLLRADFHVAVRAITG